MLRNLKYRFVTYCSRLYRSWRSNEKFNTINDWNKISLGDYSKVFLEHRGLKSQKWSHYLPIYDELVSEVKHYFPGDVRVLEIGVQSGGCLQIWRKIFGDNANIFGLDINPKCSELGINAQVRIGNSSDINVIKSIVEEMNTIDLIIDDGSHDSLEQRKTFELLFPHLSDFGIYIIEDLEHSYYWSQHGGYLRPSSFIQRCKRLVDDLNRNYFSFPRLPSFQITKYAIGSVSFHSGLVVIRKRPYIHPHIIWTDSGEVSKTSVVRKSEK